MAAAARVSRTAARARAAARRAADGAAVHAVEVTIAPIICAECARHASVGAAAHSSKRTGRLTSCWPASTVPSVACHRHRLTSGAGDRVARRIVGVGDLCRCTCIRRFAVPTRVTSSASTRV